MFFSTTSRFVCVALVALFAVFSLTTATAANIYIFDGKSLQESRSSDPSGIQAEEWQIWLYARGQKTGGTDHWGTISAKSVSSANAQLKSGQQFEVKYCRFMGESEDCESKDTYFNPLGPIAIVRGAKSTPQQVIDAFSQFQDAQDRIGKLADLRNALDKPFNPYTYTGDPTTNPYAGIGNSVKEYGEELSQVVTTLKRASDAIRAACGRNMNAVMADLQEFQNGAQAAENSATYLEGKSNSILKAYDQMQVTAVKPSPPKGGGGDTPPAISGNWVGHNQSHSNESVVIEISGTQATMVDNYEINIVGGNTAVECRMSGHWGVDPDGILNSKAFLMDSTCRFVSGFDRDYDLPVKMKATVDPDGSVIRLFGANADGTTANGFYSSELWRR
jgi:hypothetical protein